MKKLRILFLAALTSIVIMLCNVLIAESASGNIVRCYEILGTCPNSPSFDVYFCGSCSVRMASSYSEPKNCMHRIVVDNPNVH